MKSEHSPYLKHLFVCVNKRDPGVTCCSHGGGEAIRQKLKDYVKAKGLKGKVRISGSGCQDLCAKGPNVMVYPDYQWYHHVSLDDVDRIIEEHLAPLVSNPAPVSPGHSSIRAFFFDLGNVIVQFDHMIAAQQIARHAKTNTDHLYRMFFESPLIEAHDAGRVSTKSFFEQLKSELGLTLSYDEFLSLWNGIFAENQKVSALVRHLMKSYPCLLISNTNRPHFEYCREHYPVLNEMTGWVLSYEIGFLKPHPVIYHRGLELVQMPASQVFYVDDREDLVEAAGKLGFQTHRFQGVELLLSELKNKGVLNGK